MSASPLDSISNTIRDALQNTLQKELPARLTALGLDQIQAWEKYCLAYPTSIEAPALSIYVDRFAQPQGTFSGGGSAVGDRKYTFSVALACSEANEEDVAINIAAYVDAIASVLDDTDLHDLGNSRILNVWPESGNIDAGAIGGTTSGFFRIATMVVSVQWSHITGSYKA